MKKLFSTFLIFYLIISIVTSTTVTVGAVSMGESQGLTSDAPLNSWRYRNGVPDNAQSQSYFSVGQGNAWIKTDNGFVNDQGNVIVGATMKGIDVSQWNGNIDWEKVAQSDVDYAIIRVGYGNDEVAQDDKQFQNNIKGCVENKIPFGVYIYSYATNISMARSEAEHTLRLIKDYELNFPVYYDLEDNSLTNLSADNLGVIAKTFCDVINDAGYEVGIYANLNWWNNYLTDPVFDSPNWYKWVAQYNSVCNYQKPYTMWQCCSNGKVDGIDGLVDINFWYSDVRDFDYKATFENQTVSVTSVKLNVTSRVLNKGEKTTLKATVYPVYATDKSVKWTSNNTNVATVTSSGVVTAKSKGTAYIRATANDGSKKYRQCKVTVKQPVTAVKLNTISKTVNRGSRFTLKATVYPTNANVRTVTWKSLNTRVATVTSTGVVTAKAKGATYVRATANDGSKKYAQCRIIVKQPVTSVKLNATSKTVKRGSRFTLKATVYPTNANVRSVTWQSSNKRVATVTSTGVVTAKTRGTAYVRATAKDGSKKYAQCKITVK